MLNENEHGRRRNLSVSIEGKTLWYFYTEFLIYTSGNRWKVFYLKKKKKVLHIKRSDVTERGALLINKNQLKVYNAKRQN